MTQKEEQAIVTVPAILPDPRIQFPSIVPTVDARHLTGAHWVVEKHCAAPTGLQQSQLAHLVKFH